MNAKTVLYRNTADHTIVHPLLGELEPGQEVSVTTEQHYPYNNHPDVNDIEAVEVSEQPAENDEADDE